MKVLLDIKDEKASFVLELLGSLKFVKVKPIASNSSRIQEGLRGAVDQVHAAKKGKIKLKKAADFLNEI